MRAATTILGVCVLGATLWGATTWGTPELVAAPDREPADAASERQPHPLYDDGGTLDWRTSLPEAMEITGERRRLIFIEWGRES